MSEFSNYLENALLNAVLRNTTYTSPTTCFVGLFTSDPTDAGSGTECTGGSYARIAVSFNAPTNGVATNSADVTFSQATDNWGTISHIGLHDADTTGNLLFHTILNSSKAIGTGDQFKITAGALTCTLE
jgi:hypothetical protein